MRRRFFGRPGKFLGAIAATLLLLAHAPLARAVSEAEKTFLSLYFSDEELQVVSATRSLQSIARVAENIEVITADDIELMNAHTLADVLNTVVGVRANLTGAFGAVALPYIQGSEFTQVTVLLDGVPLNNISDNVTDVAFVPVTDVARIEIVKGPASSAWGSALGGVVNVITRDPAAAPFRASASFDYGRDRSADYRAAVSGRVGGLGYALSGTGLRTDGLTEGFDVHDAFLGAKLTYAVSARTDLTVNLQYGDGDRGDGNAPDYDLAWDRETRQTVARLALRSAIGDAGRLDASVWSVDADEKYFMRLLASGEEQARSTIDWSRRGAALSYSRQAGAHAFVVGSDYAAGDIETSDFPGRSPDVDQWAVYANDTITLGPLTLIPGVRYDDVSISGTFVSPSLGATYAVSRNALLRAAVARGFSLPSPIDTAAGTSEIMGYTGNPDLKPETIWSYQVGAEASVLDALWLKAHVFRHDVDDAFTLLELGDGFRTQVNGGRKRRQGIELGLKTVPYRHVTLSGGAMFMKGEDLESGQDLTSIPERQFNVSVKYDDERSFRALVTGIYRDETWAPVDVYNADMSGFIVDLHLAKKFAIGAAGTVEAFVSVHNLLDQNQYYADIYKNPSRWAEGGVRVAF